MGMRAGMPWYGVNPTEGPVEVGYGGYVPRYVGVGRNVGGM